MLFNDYLFYTEADLYIKSIQCFYASFGLALACMAKTESKRLCLYPTFLPFSHAVILILLHIVPLFIYLCIYFNQGFTPILFHLAID